MTPTAPAGPPDTPAPASIHPVPGLPEVRPGDDLAGLLLNALATGGLAPRDGDVLVVAQKVVSKAEGSRVALAEVTPSAFARRWAAAWGRDPRLVELVLRESRRIVRMERGLIIAETHHGFVCANAGVDLSNAGQPGEGGGAAPSDADAVAVLLPEDPDRAARQLRERLEAAHGARLGVIVADTFGRPWRVGLTQVALGVAGLPPLHDLREHGDADGRPLHATVIAVADELACAADLVCGKVAGVPAALVRGWRWPEGQAAADGRALLRDPAHDLFR